MVCVTFVRYSLYCQTPYSMPRSGHEVSYLSDTHALIDARAIKKVTELMERNINT